MRKNIIKIMSMVVISNLVLGCAVISAQTSVSDTTTATATPSSTPKEVLPSVLDVCLDKDGRDDGPTVYSGRNKDSFTYILRDKVSQEVTLPTSYTYRNHVYPITQVNGIDSNAAQTIIAPSSYTKVDLDPTENLKKIIIENDSATLKYLKELQEAQVYVERKGHDEVTVTYLNLDGSIKALEVVDRGSSAKYVGTVEKPYFTFKGWTGADLTNVTENITVKPVIELTKTETAGKLCLANDDVLVKDGFYDDSYEIKPQFENVTGDLDYKVIISSDKGMHATYTKEFLETESWQYTEVYLPLVNDVYDVCVIATDSSEVTYEKHIALKPYGIVRDTQVNSKSLVDYFIEPVKDNLVIGDRIYFTASYNGDLGYQLSAFGYKKQYPAVADPYFAGEDFNPTWDEDKQMYYIQFDQAGEYRVMMGHSVMLNSVIVKDPTPEVIPPAVDDNQTPPVVDEPSVPTVKEPSSTVEEPTTSPVVEPTASPSTETVVDNKPAPTGDVKGLQVIVGLMILSAVGIKRVTSK